MKVRFCKGHAISKVLMWEWRSATLLNISVISLLGNSRLYYKHLAILDQETGRNVTILLSAKYR